MQAEIQAQPVHNAAVGDFGGRVAPLDPGYRLASRAVVHDVRHGVLLRIGSGSVQQYERNTGAKLIMCFHPKIGS